MDFETRLNAQRPAFWKAEPGVTIIGTVLDVYERTDQYNGNAYPVIELTTENGDVLAVHAWHAVLKQKIAQKQPLVGDRMGIKCLGQPDGKNYMDYNVVVDHVGAAPTVDWVQMEADAREELPF